MLPADAFQTGLAVYLDHAGGFIGFQTRLQIGHGGRGRLLHAL